MNTDEEVAPSIGLALSGGGFRAAFFHVGVLARLAELDLLRHVQTLSCVSGGSIAGATYYLALLRQRLPAGALIEKGRPLTLDPSGLERDDYLEAVRLTRRALLYIATKRNLRSRVFANPVKNLTMYLSPRYSRTDRAGDILDRHLRTQLDLDPGKRGSIPGKQDSIANQISLRSLHVQRVDFPRLVLNATTLNSGHNWRFHTDGMGEEPLEGCTRDDIDRNDRFAWTRYEDIKESEQDFPLGLAVAASACFPGLFRPLPVTHLYPGYRVDLMDGGAQDNQGIQTLIEQKPSLDLLIVSDGSGQLDDMRFPAKSVPSVVMRVVAMQADRIREEQLVRAHSVRPLCLVHLRQGIAPDVLRPVSAAHDSPPDDIASETSSMGLDIQSLIAGIRTDLDRFSELEALALVEDAYQAARSRFQEDVVAPYATDPGEQVDSWAGPTVPGLLKSGPRPVRTHLAAAKLQWAKPWLVLNRSWVASTAVAAVVVAAGWRVAQALPEHEMRSLALGVGILIVPAILSRIVLVGLMWRRSPLLERSRHTTLRVITGICYFAFTVAAIFAADDVAAGLGAGWSQLQATATVVALLALPALAPTLLAGLWWVEGRLWSRKGRLAGG